MEKINWVNDSDEEIKKKIKNSTFDNDMLMNSAYHGRVEIIKFMKKEKYIDKETINEMDILSGYCPLHNAVLGGSAEAVETLIKFGADVNKRCSRHRETPIHIAASLGHTQIIKSLIGHGVDVNTVLDTGITPLHLAAYEGQMEAVEALIELGADVNAQDKTGETVLHLARRGGFPEIAKVLIKNGAGKKKGKAKAPSSKKNVSNDEKTEGNHLSFLVAIRKRARGLL